MISRQQGSIIMWVLVFGNVLLIILVGILGYLISQIRENQQAIARDEALHIAEAGLNYARWHLSHDEEGYGFSGVYNYQDPEGRDIGDFELNITAPSGCDPGVKIEAIGKKQGYPELARTLRVRYAKPALAKFAFLINTNAWFGDEERLEGPVHSNGGIRMDGTQNSLFTSAQNTYICGSEHGCFSADCNDPCFWQSGVGCQCPGIWGEGSGGDVGLWDFPASNVDFDNITQDLATLKSEAQASGIYLGDSGEEGYHLVFKNNSTVDIYEVTDLKPQVWGYNGSGWVSESNSIDDENFISNVVLPSSCSPIFIEDDVWVNGVVNGRVALVAARLPDMPSNNAKMIINDNITYHDLNSVLGLIAQKDILIPLYSPNDLIISAAMLAQKGHIFRYYYPHWSWEPYHTYSRRDTIITFGSIISNSFWTFTWVSESGGSFVFESGYEFTDMGYDASLTYNPPPFFPVSGEYELVNWEEVE